MFPDVFVIAVKDDRVFREKKGRELDEPDQRGVDFVLQSRDGILGVAWAVRVLRFCNYVVYQGILGVAGDRLT